MHTHQRATISAFIVCCNEERQIRRCLESVKWCDEIVVVDSGSTDATLEICREYTAKIYHRAWEGYVIQKRFALEQCSSDWVLNIDADEEVSPELQREIQAILVADTAPARPEIHGYYLNRVVYFLQRWWRKGGWYPEYRLRLCRRAVTTWGGEDPHEKAFVRGATKRCVGELFHYSFTDLTDYVRRLNTLSANAAHTLIKKGRSGSLINIILHPLARFFKFYVSKRGFREGTAGLIVATIEAYSAFLKYAKVWELQNRAQHQQAPEAPDQRS
jgi:glycosyltransferase involved in cell wall biosynthesis